MLTAVLLSIQGVAASRPSPARGGCWQSRMWTELLGSTWSGLLQNVASGGRTRDVQSVSPCCESCSRQSLFLCCFPSSTMRFPSLFAFVLARLALASEPEAVFCAPTVFYCVLVCQEYNSLINGIGETSIFKCIVDKIDTLIVAERVEVYMGETPDYQSLLQQIMPP